MSFADKMAARMQMTDEQRQRYDERSDEIASLHEQAREQEKQARTLADRFHTACTDKSQSSYELGTQAVEAYKELLAIWKRIEKLEAYKDGGRPDYKMLKQAGKLEWAANERAETFGRWVAEKSHKVFEYGHQPINRYHELTQVYSDMSYARVKAAYE